MDMNELNKSQLILLAVLLSFITSIVTGITTVTLMQQAPVSFTEPVNRVVQQTVEKIQQVEGKTVTQTVVIKEEDLVVDALSKNKPAVFDISKNGADGTEISAGSGFVINTDGVVVADAALVPGGETYFLTNQSGKFKATFIATDKSGVSFLKIGDAVDGKSKISYKVPSFADFSKVKVGQKIIVLGKGINTFIFDGNKDIKISNPKSNAGALVFDLDGDVLGLALSSEATSFASSDNIMAAYTQAVATPAKAQ